MSQTKQLKRKNLIDKTNPDQLMAARPYTAHKRENPAFERYYANQLGLDDADHAALIAALRTPLPTTFRLTATSPLAPLVAERLRALVAALPAEHRPAPLPWYPGGTAYAAPAAPPDVRGGAAYGAFRRFLIAETDGGEISRQEAVSMVPPLFLGVGATDAVLDLCAAPGSKTAQLLEAVGEGGLVVANDVDSRRCELLAHQTKRLQSPHLVVTNHAAQRFPTGFLFDRVLCDVPCSGDGTLRKNPDGWGKWTCERGVQSHGPSSGG